MNNELKEYKYIVVCSPVWNCILGQRYFLNILFTEINGKTLHSIRKFCTHKLKFSLFVVVGIQIQM